jgi:hypothetical protein
MAGSPPALPEFARKNCSTQDSIYDRATIDAGNVFDE